MDSNVMVVGDKFYQFAQNKNVITVSQLELISQIPANIIDGHNKFHAGQGVRNDFITKIAMNQEKNRRYDNKLDLEGLNTSDINSKNIYAHKHNQFNILIGPSHRTNENVYSLPLLIDERCELMSDHQTGQHIQGMIQIEACRQAFIAVTEEFYLKGGEQAYYYVINNMDTSFLHFLFPLPATLSYEVLEQDINTRRARFKANISVKQNNIVCASVAVGFTVYPSDVISAKEATMANEATMAVLKSIHNSAPTEQKNACETAY
ncbi:TPA: hypothetical protein LVM22_001124 [Klebsiella oxytoca]|nr:hypothetical protein [Klebsiella oxytoca]